MDLSSACQITEKMPYSMEYMVLMPFQMMAR